MKELLLTFLKIGLIGYGGGNAVFRVLLSEVVEKKGWFTLPEIVNMFSLAQTAPGLIIPKLAVICGYKKAGIPGAIVSFFAVNLPGIIICMAIFAIYWKYGKHPVFNRILCGIKPIVAALVFSAFLMIFKGGNLLNWKSILIFCGALVMLIAFKIHPLWLIIAGICLGLLIFK